MESVSIFYSWQSNNQKTKGFISKALSNSITELAGKNILEKSPRLDRDTQGSVGSPNIATTIKDKIDNCGIFVADVSMVDLSTSGAKLVNQNVMFELGYAIAKHSEHNVVMLFNADLGDPKDLPFDISHHRVLQFSIEKDDKNGSKLKEKLVGALTAHLNSLDEQDIDKVEKSLDDIQLVIMRAFAAMEDEKRIMVSVHMGGSDLMMAGQVKEEIHNQIKRYSTQEVVANMDDLVQQNILKLAVSSRGTPNYTLAKKGFDIIKMLKTNDE